MGESVQIEIADKVATITICREERRNSLDHVAMARLAEILTQCEKDGVGAILITGAGGKSFCAGDDVKAYGERTNEESKAHFELGVKTFDHLENHPCLTIAAVEGFCLGGGLELALCCDLRIAGESAQFGLPEIPKLNAFPSWGGLTRLPKIIGTGKAKQMAFMGERIDAIEAMRIGLVAKAVPEGTALDVAREFATGFAASVSRDTVDVAKRVMNDAAKLPATASSLVNLLAERSQTFEGA